VQPDKELSTSILLDNRSCTLPGQRIHEDGTLGHADFYQGRVEAIQGSGFPNSREIRVEAGSNTSTVTLRVVGGDEKGSLESETVKYGSDSEELVGWRLPRDKEEKVLSVI
jgi:hypothetical protein